MGFVGFTNYKYALEDPTFTQVDWQGLTSMGTILIIPAVVITVFTQKHLVRGLTTGAVKA